MCQLRWWQWKKRCDVCNFTFQQFEVFCSCTVALRCKWAGIGIVSFSSIYFVHSSSNGTLPLLTVVNQLGFKPPYYGESPSICRQHVIFFHWAETTMFVSWRFGDIYSLMGLYFFLMNQLLGQGDPVLSQVRLTWRIIPPSKWLIKPVGKSPFRGLIPSTYSGWLRNPAPVGNYW